MLKQILSEYTIILASGSPRRQLFFQELDLKYRIEVRPVEETYPAHLKAQEITDYLSQLKAAAFTELSEKDIVVTSDTIVWKNGKAIEKPKNLEDAKRMLQDLSGDMHEVYTSVCFTLKNEQKTVHDVTKVWFKQLTEKEIDFYLQNYQPFDKAGSYGIQEWIGYIGIEKIEGSYFNVMGLPTHKVYKTFVEIANSGLFH